MLDMEGQDIPPCLRLGQRVEIGPHSDKYEVQHQSGVFVSLLNARVFDLAPEPVKVRKHRLRCIKRLEPRKVLNDTQGNLHIVVFVKDIDTEDDQIARDAQEWLDFYERHLEARLQENLPRQAQADTPVDIVSPQAASEVSQGLAPSQQITNREFMRGLMVILLLVVLLKLIHDPSFLAYPINFSGLAKFMFFFIEMMYCLLT